MPVGGSAVMLLAKVFEPSSYEHRLERVVFLLVTGALGLVVAALLANLIRPYLKLFFLRTACTRHV